MPKRKRASESVQLKHETTRAEGVGAGHLKREQQAEETDSKSGGAIRSKPSGRSAKVKAKAKANAKSSIPTVQGLHYATAGSDLTYLNESGSELKPDIEQHVILRGASQSGVSNKSRPLHGLQMCKRLVLNRSAMIPSRATTNSNQVRHMATVSTGGTVSTVTAYIPVKSVNVGTLVSAGNRTEFSVQVPSVDQLAQFHAEEIEAQKQHLERLKRHCQLVLLTMTGRESILDRRDCKDTIATIEARLRLLQNLPFDETTAIQSAKDEAFALSKTSLSEAIDEEWNSDLCPKCPTPVYFVVVQRESQSVCPKCGYHAKENAVATAGGRGWSDEPQEPESQNSAASASKQFRRYLRVLTWGEPRPGKEAINVLRRELRYNHTSSHHKVRSTFISMRAKARQMPNVNTYLLYLMRVLRGEDVAEISPALRDTVSSLFQQFLYVYPMFQQISMKNLIQKPAILRAILEHLGHSNAAECVDACKLPLSAIRNAVIMEQVFKHCGRALRLQPPVYEPPQQQHHHQPVLLARGGGGGDGHTSISSARTSMSQTDTALCNAAFSIGRHITTTTTTTHSSSSISHAFPHAARSDIPSSQAPDKTVVPYWGNAGYVSVHGLTDRSIGGFVMDLDIRCTQARQLQKTCANVKPETKEAATLMLVVDIGIHQRCTTLLVMMQYESTIDAKLMCIRFMPTMFQCSLPGQSSAAAAAATLSSSSSSAHATSETSGEAGMVLGSGTVRPGRYWFPLRLPVHDITPFFNVRGLNRSDAVVISVRRHMVHRFRMGIDKTVRPLHASKTHSAAAKIGKGMTKRMLAATAAAAGLGSTPPIRGYRPPATPTMSDSTSLEFGVDLSASAWCDYRSAVQQQSSATLPASPSSSSSSSSHVHVSLSTTPELMGAVPVSPAAMMRQTSSQSLDVAEDAAYWSRMHGVVAIDNTQYQPFRNVSTSKRKGHEFVVHRMSTRELEAWLMEAHCFNGSEETVIFRVRTDEFSMTVPRSVPRIQFDARRSVLASSGSSPSSHDKLMPPRRKASTAAASSSSSSKNGGWASPYTSFTVTTPSLTRIVPPFDAQAHMRQDREARAKGGPMARHALVADHPYTWSIQSSTVCGSSLSSNTFATATTPPPPPAASPLVKTEPLETPRTPKEKAKPTRRGERKTERKTHEDAVATGAVTEEERDDQTSFCYQVPLRALLQSMKFLGEEVRLRFAPGMPLIAEATLFPKQKPQQTAVHIAGRECAWPEAPWLPIQLGVQDPSTNAPIPNADMVARDRWVYYVSKKGTRTSVSVTSKPSSLAGYMGMTVTRTLAAHPVPHLSPSYWERHALRSGDVRFSSETLYACDLWIAAVLARASMTRSSVKAMFASRGVSWGCPRDAADRILKNAKSFRFPSPEERPTVLYLDTNSPHRPFLPVVLVNESTHDTFVANAIVDANPTSYDAIPCRALMKWKGTLVVSEGIESDSHLCLVHRVVPSEQYSSIFGEPRCLAVVPREVIVLSTGRRYALTEEAFLLGRRDIDAGPTVDGYGIFAAFREVMARRRATIAHKVDSKKQRRTRKEQAAIASAAAAAAAAASRAALLSADQPEAETSNNNNNNNDNDAAADEHKRDAPKKRRRSLDVTTAAAAAAAVTLPQNVKKKTRRGKRSGSDT